MAWIIENMKEIPYLHLSHIAKKHEHIATKLAQTLTGPPIQYHLVIVVSEKEVGLGYVLVQCTNPRYYCLQTKSTCYLC